jgi:hypothetical protein
MIMLECCKHSERRAKGITEIEYCWCWWLVTVIPASQEAEIKRVTVRRQLG